MRDLIWKKSLAPLEKNLTVLSPTAFSLNALPRAPMVSWLCRHPHTSNVASSINSCWVYQCFQEFMMCFSVFTTYLWCVSLSLLIRYLPWRIRAPLNRFKVFYDVWGRFKNIQWHLIEMKDLIQKKSWARLKKNLALSSRLCFHWTHFREHPWSSGYDVSLTRWRSPVQSWLGVSMFSRRRSDDI